MICVNLRFIIHYDIPSLVKTLGKYILFYLSFHIAGVNSTVIPKAEAIR